MAINRAARTSAIIAGGETTLVARIQTDEEMIDELRLDLEAVEVGASPDLTALTSAVAALTSRVDAIENLT